MVYNYTKAFISKNPEVKSKITTSFRTITNSDASHLLVFANIVDVQDQHIDEYIQNILTQEVYLKPI